MHIADRHWISTRSQYLAGLEKGQVLPLENLPETSVPVTLVHNDQLLNLLVFRPSHNEYLIKLNKTEINLEIVRLSDGGILVQLNGVSYCSYLQETILNFRVTINNQTVVFEKENDPSILRAPSPGKLLKFVVENGAEVSEGDIYAEIEVMKMVMAIKVSSSGKITFEKKPGTVLANGTIIARLALTENEKIKMPEPYEKDFSDFIKDGENTSTTSDTSINSDDSPNADFRRRTGSDLGGLLDSQGLLIFFSHFYYFHEEYQQNLFVIVKYLF